QRSERRRGRRDGQALDPTTISAVADDTVYAEIELLDRLLLRLGPEQRSVFVLVVLEDVEPRDVADALQVSINTVYSRLRLAKRRLRVAFAELGGQSEEGAGN